LTGRIFLKLLAGGAYSGDRLLASVWGAQRFVTPRTVVVHIRHLTTVRGFGYRFEEAV
jgi:DNA-binding response OmpR family regulator